jgi:hypothetical protein
MRRGQNNIKIIYFAVGGFRATGSKEGPADVDDDESENLTNNDF